MSPPGTRVSAPGNASTSVSILMGVYNGEKFLREQIDSIIEQTHKNWHLLIAIDAAQDNSRQIIEEYQRRLGDKKLIVMEGSKAGYFHTFMKLLASTRADSTYAAFCDQDDIWHRDKLQTAIAKLELKAMGQPAIYCGRTRLVDEHGSFIGNSPLFKRRPGFRNALVQSIAGGNTMVLNREAIDLVNSHKVEQNLSGHDWWVYLLVSGAGGKVIYDPNPKIDYRQHGGNLIGSNRGIQSRFKRLKLLISGRFRGWMSSNLAALDAARLNLTPANLRLFQNFARSRQADTFSRLRIIHSLKLRRQTLLGTISLHIGMLLKWV